VKRPLDIGYASQVVALVQERAKTLCELAEVSGFFFLEEMDYPVDLLVKGGMTRGRASELLGVGLLRLESLEPFDVVSLESLLRSLAEELSIKTGEFFGLLRVAITGRTATPPLFETMMVLGRDRCLRRIKAAIDRLQSSAGP